MVHWQQWYDVGIHRGGGVGVGESRGGKGGMEDRNSFPTGALPKQ